MRQLFVFAMTTVSPLTSLVTSNPSTRPFPFPEFRLEHLQKEEEEEEAQQVQQHQQQKVLLVEGRNHAA